MKEKENNLQQLCKEIKFQRFYCGKQEEKPNEFNIK